MIVNSLEYAIHRAGKILYQTGKKSKSEKWQSIESPDLFLETLFHSFRAPIPVSIEELKNQVKPNLPWAEEHFEERVSGLPLNPPPSHINWPFAQKKNDKHTEEKLFSHTYPERFWPKIAGDPEVRKKGIRFNYGDLDDVIELLIKDPNTRQAYLPVFFPEDTGAHHGKRIPCTIGYQFMWRKGYLHCIYTIRSCDYLRHFRDDIYMAGRLAQWISDQLESRNPYRFSCKPGFLKMDIGSLHMFWSEKKMLRRLLNLKEP